MLLGRAETGATRAKALWGPGRWWPSVIVNLFGREKTASSLPSPEVSTEVTETEEPVSKGPRLPGEKQKESL